MRGRPGTTYGEPLPPAIIRALHQAHIDGIGWLRMAQLSDVDKLTLRRALRRRPVRRDTRDRIEAWLAAYERSRRAA